jgi:hypothetical protein
MNENPNEELRKVGKEFKELLKKLDRRIAGRTHILYSHYYLARSMPLFN